MIIIDTDALVPGLLTGDNNAPTARILDAALIGGLRCLLSPALLDEYRAALLRAETDSDAHDPDADRGNMARIFYSCKW